MLERKKCLYIFYFYLFFVWILIICNIKEHKRNKNKKYKKRKRKEKRKEKWYAECEKKLGACVDHQITTNRNYFNLRKRYTAVNKELLTMKDKLLESTKEAEELRKEKAALLSEITELKATNQIVMTVNEQMRIQNAFLETSIVDQQGIGTLLGKLSDNVKHLLHIIPLHSVIRKPIIATLVQGISWRTSVVLFDIQKDSYYRAKKIYGRNSQENIHAQEKTKEQGQCQGHH